MLKLAIIGTAGRDKSIQMTRALWNWMCSDIQSRVPVGSHVVSGGAAWADHLAVGLFLCGHASHLTLHLPAPFDLSHNRFIGGYSTAGNAANYYHRLFSEAIRCHTLDEIADVLSMPNCVNTQEPVQPGYGGMYARNKLVAQADQLFAYTFGKDSQPADGGTSNTWKMCKGERVHISLPRYLQHD